MIEVADHVDGRPAEVGDGLLAAPAALLDLVRLGPEPLPATRDEPLVGEEGAEVDALVEGLVEARQPAR